MIVELTKKDVLQFLRYAKTRKKHYGWFLTLEKYNLSPRHYFPIRLQVNKEEFDSLNEISQLSKADSVLKKVNPVKKKNPEDIFELNASPAQIKNLYNWFKNWKPVDTELKRLKTKIMKLPFDGSKQLLLTNYQASFIPKPISTYGNIIQNTRKNPIKVIR